MTSRVVSSSQEVGARGLGGGGRVKAFVLASCTVHKAGWDKGGTRRNAGQTGRRGELGTLVHLVRNCYQLDKNGWPDVFLWMRGGEKEEPKG